MNSGLVNRAYNTLLYYRNMNRNFQRTTDVRDVRLYNVLLAGFARKVRRKGGLSGGGAGRGDGGTVRIRYCILRGEGRCDMKWLSVTETHFQID